MWHHEQFSILLSKFLFSWMMHKQTQVSQKGVVFWGTSDFGWQSQVTDFFHRRRAQHQFASKSFSKRVIVAQVWSSIFIEKAILPCHREWDYHCAHPGGLAPCQDLGEGIPEARCDLSKAARFCVAWGTRTDWSSEITQAFSLGVYKYLKYVRTQFFTRTL